jgi:hypothetical protein
MADRVLFIGWGTPVRGSEGRGLEVFNEALGLLGRMQQEGRIEGFNVVLLDPNSDLNGYVEVQGSAEQITALHTGAFACPSAGLTSKPSLVTGALFLRAGRRPVHSSLSSPLLDADARSGYPRPLGADVNAAHDDMDHDELRDHISSAALRGGSETRHITYRMLRACWPGGSEDRTEPAALAWLGRWRPDPHGASLPACFCSSGRCLLCN